MLGYLRRMFRVRRCAHYWRPAKTSKGPARYCDDCERVEQLSGELFFAEFGESGIQRLRNMGDGTLRARVK